MSRVGSHDDFDALWCDHYQALWAMAYARLRDADIAQDIASEAYLRLWDEWQNGEAIPNPVAWLRCVARNLAADYAKSAFRRRGFQGPDFVDHLRSTEPSPPQSVMAAEILGMALDQLAPADRELILLKAEGLSNEALAGHFGQSIRCIRRWLGRVRATLRDRINHLSEEPTPDRKRKPRSAS